VVIVLILFRLFWSAKNFGNIKLARLRKTFGTPALDETITNENYSPQLDRAGEKLPINHPVLLNKGDQLFLHDNVCLHMTKRAAKN